MTFRRYAPIGRVGGGTSPLTTKGDIAGFDTAAARIPVGTNEQVLIADSAQALGVRWATIGAANITDGSVTNADLFDMNANTIKARPNGTSGTPTDVSIGASQLLGRTSTGNLHALTTTEITTLVNAFTSSLSGAAPSSGGGTTNYLRADATWAAPPGTTGPTYVVQASDQTTGTPGTTKVDITDLNFTPSASTTYLVEFFLMIETNNINNGVELGIDWPGGMNENTGAIQMFFTNALSTSATFLRGEGGATDFAALGTSLTPANTPMPHWGWALVDVGGSPTGNFSLTIASEAAGPTFNVTVKAGSTLRYTAIA